MNGFFFTHFDRLPGCRRALRGSLQSGPVFFAALFTLIALPGFGHASCNLRPIAATSYASTKGGVISPITAPGETVQLELNGCDPTNGFEIAPTDNEITITFEPPAGAPTDVIVAGGLIDSTDNCTLPDGRCRTLKFEMPDTSAVLPPYGLAGPARITVRDLTNTVVAEIAEINLPALSCDKSIETVFQKFTVLPPPNNFADLDDGTVTEVLATVDGGNNLLIPLDYWGDGLKSVLFERPGTLEASFLEGPMPLEAINGGGTSIGEILALEPEPSRFLRSFTLVGRPLPPLLRLKGDGSGLYGTADAPASVLRIAINDGMGGGDLYDVTDRLSAGGRGPILIPVAGADFSVGSPIPLKSLRSSASSVAYARDESRELVDLNADTDQVDFVVQVVDGEDAGVTDTGEAVSDVANDFFTAPAIAAAGDTVAYLLNEFAQGNGDANADADTTDSILRVLSRDGTNLAPGQLPDVSLSRLVNDFPMAISGPIVFYRGPNWSVTMHVEPAAMFGLAISPNGADVYGTSNVNNAVYHMTRNLVTGALTVMGQSAPSAGMTGATGVVVSPDGNNVYVAGDAGHAVTVFDRLADPDLGSQVQQVLAVNPGVPIFGARALAMSSDSQFLYVASNVSDSLSVFERTGGQGQLTFVESEINGLGAPVVTGLDNPEGVVVSPDGLHVYASAASSSSVAAFSRNALTGELTFIEAEFDGVGGVDGIGGATALAISPDGKHVYVTGAFDRAVGIFERNAISGELTYVGAHFDAQDTFTTLDGAAGIAVSPDGQRVYVTARLAASLLVFRRNAETGDLLLEDTIVGLGVTTLPIGVAVEPTAGKHVYVASNGGLPTGVVPLRTEFSLSALDTGTGFVLTIEPPATRAAVAAERAAFLRPESADGVDLNGDGDPAGPTDTYDDIVQLYDATIPVTGGVTSLDIAGNRVTISDSLVAFTVPEANEGNLPLNGDGDTRDDVLHVYEIGEMPAPANVVNVGVTADSIGVVGDTVVFTTREADEPVGGPGCAATIPPGGCDLNGDGDAFDRILRLYDYNPGINSGIITEIGEPVQEFVLAGQLVAFRTSEMQAGENLNPDGGDADENDFVMQVYDLATDELLNTSRSAISCFFPDCDPVLPYKAIDLGDTRVVAHLTDEADESADLDLDGDANDIVLTLYNVRTRTVHTIAKVIDDPDGDEDDPDVSPFPEDPFDGTLIIDEILESDIGIDVNLDGDLDDVVVMLIGDSDGDGTLDEFDPCPDLDTADATDGDGDGLGDSDCDPVVPPPATPTPRLTCREPLQTGKAQIQFKNKDGVFKDQFKFKWAKGEQTDVSDFGDPAGDTSSVYVLYVYDGSAKSQPVYATAMLPGPLACGKKPCWKASGTNGFKFKDKLGVPRGVAGAKLKAGDDGKAGVQVKGSGKGGRLRIPLLPLQTPVTVQLVTTVGGGEECWSATFSSGEGDSTKWKAKSD